MLMAGCIWIFSLMILLTSYLLVSSFIRRSFFFRFEIFFYFFVGIEFELIIDSGSNPYLIISLTKHFYSFCRHPLLMKEKGDSTFAPSYTWQSFSIHLVCTQMLNSEPTPYLLLTATEPPICSIIFLQMLRPSPVPCLFLWEFSSSLLKSMNSFLTPSSLMPTPVSITLIWILTNFSHELNYFR